MMGQITECATPHPSTEEMATIAAAIVNNSNSVAANSFVFDIPVRANVFRLNDGGGYFINLDEAYIDGFLADMNAKMSGGTNTFNFFRCGPLNVIDVDQLYYGSVDASDFSYNRNYLNLYLYNKFGAVPNATFPWSPEPREVNLTAASADVANGTGFHELGHTLGLFHTFSPQATFRVPVSTSQQDYPYILGGRELVIRDTVLNKPFPYPNATYAGDWVADTPPGCNSDPVAATQYPDSSTIAGCLDNNSSTPCLSGCLDASSATPCANGCKWDLNNCTYVGNYRDYNFDPIVDPGNILARNYMSYTGSCRTEFTPGQKTRASEVFQSNLFGYYEPDFCGNMVDKVELEGSNVGLNQVSLRIVPKFTPSDYTAAVVSANGQFSGKITDNIIAIQIGSDVRRFRKNDIREYANDWTSGLSVSDLVCIERHVFQYDTLNGYKLLAADADKNNRVSQFDKILFRKLLLGIDTALANYKQPWRFIPEVVTQLPNGAFHSEFDGIGSDNPFKIYYNDPATGLDSIISSDYCEPGWIYGVKKNNNGRNGFDAVKLGNICKDEIVVTDSTGLAPSDPSGKVLMVSSGHIAENEVVDLVFKAHNFKNIAGFQIGADFPSEYFEFLGAESNVLNGFSPENDCIGGINMGKSGLKLLWLSEEQLQEKSITDGDVVFSLKVRAKQAVTALDAIMEQNPQVLPTMFVTQGNGIKNNVGLEVLIKGDTRSDERNNATASGDASTIHLYCVPNIVSDATTLVFHATEDCEGLVYITDGMGKTVKTISIRAITGINTLRLEELGDLKGGVYAATIQCDRLLQSTRFIKN